LETVAGVGARGRDVLHHGVEEGLHGAADEVEALPDAAVIVRMLGDYAVLRDQARACR
jgi:hypothetical protein